MAATRSRPLLTFTSDYLSELTLATDTPAPAATHARAAAPSPEVPTSDEPTASSDFCCRTSNARFESAEALREHYHTDWYRYNLRLASRRLPPVTEAAFEALVEQASLRCVAYLT